MTSNKRLLQTYYGHRFVAIGAFGTLRMVSRWISTEMFLKVLNSKSEFMLQLKDKYYSSKTPQL